MHGEYNSKEWTDDEELQKREESVAKYGGFYVGRYEAGVPESINYGETTKYIDKANAENRNKSADQVEEKDLPASRKGLQAWNYVSQTNAKDLSEKMYADSTSVTSRLIDSYAWDTICHWLSKDNKYNVTNSTSWGNYVDVASEKNVNGLYSEHSLTYDPWKWTENQENYARGEPTFEERISLGTQTIYELATGIWERNKAKNIYDFAGNMCEWSTEVKNYKTEESEEKKYAIPRGGHFGNCGYDRCACAGECKVDSELCDISIGFRVVLYVEK